MSYDCIISAFIGLERLCASTETGSLHFYALNENDSDSVEDQEEEDLFNYTSELASDSKFSDRTEPMSMPQCFDDSADYLDRYLDLTELRRMHSLCTFDPLRNGFCAVMPPCWTEMQQAQRQRKHPHLKLDNELHTKTFRLQTDTTTWDEHVFEITVPSFTCIGHVDVNFSLHSSTPPNVEVTLLKQNNSSIGHKRDVTFAVDETVSISNQFSMHVKTINFRL